MSPELNYEVVPLAKVPLEDKPFLATQKRERTVLVVDDERVIADTLSVILSRSGFRTLTAYDASSALALARAETPDLLLSDVMMGPGMDGTQLAILLVKECPDCKVLLFSGHAATRDLLAKAREAGHDFTLMTKPVHPSDLLQRITETFSSAEMAMEMPAAD